MIQRDVFIFSIALGGYSYLFKNCLKSQKEYCSEYNFQYVVVDKEPFPLEPNQAGWLKLYLLREALNNNDYNWVVFIDADCEIRKHSPDFRDYLTDLDPGASTYMAHGFSGRINSGVIFMRNTPEARAYLDVVIKNRNNPVPEEDKAPFENGHMIRYGKSNPSVKIVDNSLWNNNIDFNPESYVQHYSGGKLRPLYLGKHPITNKIYRIRKNLKLRLKNYKSPTDFPNVENTLTWFKKEFPQFNDFKRNLEN